MDELLGYARTFRVEVLGAVRRLSQQHKARLPYAGDQRAIVGVGSSQCMTGLTDYGRVPVGRRSGDLRRGLRHARCGGQRGSQT